MQPLKSMFQRRKGREQINEKAGTDLEERA